MWSARIECGYYAGDDGAPLPPMPVEDYYRWADQGRAHWAWDNEFHERGYEQTLPLAHNGSSKARSPEL